MNPARGMREDCEPQVVLCVAGFDDQGATLASAALCGQALGACVEGLDEWGVKAWMAASVDALAQVARSLNLAGMVFQETAAQGSLNMSFSAAVAGLGGANAERALHGWVGKICADAGVQGDPWSRGAVWGGSIALRKSLSAPLDHLKPWKPWVGPKTEKHSGLCAQVAMNLLFNWANVSIEERQQGQALAAGASRAWSQARMLEAQASCPANAPGSKSRL